MRATVEGQGGARIEALRLGGVERYAAGDLAAAAALWREALDLAPDDIQAQAYVAWIELRLRADQRGTHTSRSSASSVPVSVFTADTINPIAAIADALAVDPGDGMYAESYPDEATEVRGPPDEFDNVEARVRRFLADTPTEPNLAPLLDAPILDEERLPELAGWVQPEAAAPVTEDNLAFEVEIEAEPEEPIGPATDPDAVARVTASKPAPRRLGSSFPFSARMAAARSAFDHARLDEAVSIAEEVVAAGALDPPALANHMVTLSMVFERVLGRRDRLVRLGDLPPNLDPRSAYLLSRVDGSFSIDDLIDISGMERSEAVRRVALLLRCGALVPV